MNSENHSIRPVRPTWTHLAIAVQDVDATIAWYEAFTHLSVLARHEDEAGRNVWLGKRPHVRGVAMNPVDHPHGGGEGRTSGGRHPVTPWGKPTKGKKTRSNKSTDKFIMRSRHKR